MSINDILLMQNVKLSDGVNCMNGSSISGVLAWTEMLIGLYISLRHQVVVR